MSAKVGIKAINEYISAVSVSPAGANQSALNILQYKQKRWAPFIGTSVDIIIQLSSAQLGECIGFVGHNLKTAGVMVGVYSSADSGSTWTERLAPTSIADNHAKLLAFTSSATSDYWKVSLVGSCISAYLDCLQISTLATLSKLQAPLTPAGIITAYETQYGSGPYFYAGKKSRFASIPFEINLTNQDAASIHYFAQGIADLATRYPFFYAWNYSDYPNEVVYCWIDGDITMPKYDNIQLMSWRFKCRGIRR